MDSNDRLHLKNIISANNTVDETESIREKKHSPLIRRDFFKMREILGTETLNVSHELIENAFFLYENYTDIFHKIANQTIDYKLFEDFLNVLEQIEDGIVDQHEGSYEVGKILKEVYIDSALKEGNLLDEKYNNEIVYRKALPISWKTYAQVH